MKTKQIIIVSFSLSNNGAERVFCELANEWARQGIHVLVIQFVERAYGSEGYELDGIVDKMVLKSRYKYNKTLKYFSYIKQIREIVKKKPNAVLIAYSFITQLVVSMATIFLHNEVVFSERNDPNHCPYNSVSRVIRTLTFYAADKCVFQTEDAQKYFPAPIQRKGIIIPNPVKANLPEQYRGERRNVIVTAARLRPQKNLPLLINAFSIIHKKYPEYYLEIYGIGEERERLEKQVEDLNIRNYVSFKGYCKDVDQKINDAAVYVCSSDYEGMPNSLLEAVLMGIPSVSTNCPIGGAAQIVKNEYNGLLVPPNDLESLHYAITRLIADKDLCKKVSDNGYSQRDNFNVSRIAEEWINNF